MVYSACQQVYDLNGRSYLHGCAFPFCPQFLERTGPAELDDNACPQFLEREGPAELDDDASLDIGLLEEPPVGREVLEVATGNCCEVAYDEGKGKCSMSIA